MAENSYKFELPKHHKSIIKVIGVGGGGSNAVNHMFNQGIKDVEFVICNTDAQALKTSPVPLKLQLGAHLTEGLGAGANPEKGRNAALESKEEIRELLCDTKMIFITAGMGGGTGTGAAPIIAKVARELNILTVGIVTAPFAFEGKKKMEAALNGIRELKEGCDTVLVILNDKLREIFGNLPISSAFAQADNILTTAAKGIAEIITVPGYVNVDFEDVKTVMQNSGAAVMGSAQTKGDNRARKAAEMAISSPLLNNTNIHGAQKILLSIISGEQAELSMDELTEITEYIQEAAGDEAEVIFGHGVDAELGEEIRVTVIATGFEPNENAFREDKKRVIDLESNKQIKLFDDYDNKPKPAPVNLTPVTPPVYFPPSSIKEDKEAEVNSINYQFEKSQEPAEEKEDTFMFNLGAEWEIIDKTTSSNFTPPPTPKSEPVENSLSHLESKRQALLEQSRLRVEKLRGLKPNNLNTDEFRERLDTPAFMRKNVRLQDVPHSSEKNISRYNLNDDNQILGNNRFLHDNVD
jgi:cell division protein FtsZ